MYSEAYMVPNPKTPNRNVVIDPEVCISCETCVDVCRSDVLVPNPEGGSPPIALYPDECWYCGCCQFHCPTGALTMQHPLNQRVGWKRKETGALFRVGMKNPPPSNTKPGVA